MGRDIREWFDWLVDGAPGATNPVDLLGRLWPGVAAAGIPIDRAVAFVRTLHPHIMGRSFRWRPGTPIEVGEAPHAILTSGEYAASPVARVCGTGELFRERLNTGTDQRAPVLKALAAEGMTDYLGIPLKFMNGTVHAVTFASANPAGFADEDVAALTEIARPLARVAEILALSRTAVNLLNTYVGRNAGERILRGHIQRGDTDSIRCVIWFSDLRGFTSMSDSMEPARLIRTLNEFFDCQVPAIERHGGEVLKFMGDGMLAIFPVGDEAPNVAAGKALEASNEAFDALAKLNQARLARGDPALRFGLALHVGDVAYGNIGGANRLDFTCIGPAINLAARIESLSGKLGTARLLSGAMARLVGREVRSLGEHELKGVAGKQLVYELALSGEAAPERQVD
ncbi:MAG: adenylate/guanylate cyclase domain-containing protein [Myxococcales bacterium]|nr:adenylate/guanylate cyclase domain-containing protein [Myxococcales bacterium]